MHYILFYELVNDYVTRRTLYRRDHLKNVQEAHERGELVLADALADPVDGAVLIFSGPDSTAAERFVETDPYVKNGLVTSWKIRKWSTVVGKARPPICPGCGRQLYVDVAETPVTCQRKIICHRGDRNERRGN